ncbi:MAG: cytochrome c biogenesis protein ResB, partial [Planctomycetes bacterium]|nr:cytochrome c biogenesis protein ResB [Planctomycetota bacterium]
ASHMGVVVILCGGLVGNLAGVTGSMELHEGETTYAIAAEEGGMFPLGFAVRLDRFQVEHFGSDPGDVKSFRSRLAILEGGREVLQGNVEVNHPLPYKGWLFYQANYSADDPTYSGFLAVKDPGLPWVFAGFVMIVAGAVFVFYIRPRLGGLTP